MPLTFFIQLPMKMEPIRSSETSAIKTQTPRNYPKRNILQLKHGESLKNTNQDLFESKLFTRNSKLQMYTTVGRPVVTYVCETWVLKENIKTKVRLFERKVLRRMFQLQLHSERCFNVNSISFFPQPTERCFALYYPTNALNYINCRLLKIH